MQNNTNGLNEILTLLDNLPSGGSNGFKLHSTLESVESVENTMYTCSLTENLESNVFYKTSITFDMGGPVLLGIGFFEANGMGSFNAARIFLYYAQGMYIGEAVVYAANTVGGPANYLEIDLKIDENNDAGITFESLSLVAVNVYNL